MRNLSLDVLPPSNRQKRGNVTNFSDASRRRLIDLTARLDVNGTMPKFLTLTFAGIPDHDYAKRCFRKFIKRLRRRFENLSALWRVELQKRGSAHFHLIIFNMPYVVQADLQSWWTQCTGEELSIVFITAMKNAKQVMNYVSKYIAKKSDGDGSTLLDKPSYLTDVPKLWQGRHWGVINHENLPYAKREVAYIRCSGTARYFWFMVANERLKSKPCNPLVARLYTDEAQVIYDLATEWSRASLASDDYQPRYYAFNRRDVRLRIEKFFKFRARNKSSAFSVLRKTP